MSDSHRDEDPREALESALFEIKRVITPCSSACWSRC
jgi:hypothetical protein